jgi:hypothetical protein
MGLKACEVATKMYHIVYSSLMHEHTEVSVRLFIRVCQRLSVYVPIHPPIYSYVFLLPSYLSIDRSTYLSVCV